MKRIKERREFLKKIALGSIGLTWVPHILVAPYRPLLRTIEITDPVKVRGIVKDGTKGIGGISISDGLNVAQTAKDGTFEMVTSGERPFIWMSLPSGYEIPRSETGTATFYRPLQSQNSTMDIQWDLKKTKGNDKKHGFIVMSDTQTLDAEDIRRFQEETIPDARKFLAGTSMPYFNLACGDIMYDNLELYVGYKKGIKELDIPSFQVIGNHDLDFGPTDEGSIKTFMSHFGPGYYSFNRGEVHYIVLDDVFWFGNGYIGYLDDVQYRWLENDLSLIEKGAPVVVFTHIPVYDKQHIWDNRNSPGNSVIVTNRDRLYRILEPYQSHIVTGHMHLNNSFKDGGATHHNCGAVCGAWWTGDICRDGTPNGYAIYEVDGSDVDWKYKSTGHPLDHQMRLYEPGSDPAAPDEMIANIWDIREDSLVFWYEDGIRKGKMSRRVGRDPLSVRLHEGTDKPEKHKWVEPVNTSHLFYAPVSQDSKVVVEVMGPKGKVISQNL